MDMETLMAQAQRLQNNVAQAQEHLAKTVVRGIADNGACVVDMTGKYDMLNITIRPDVLDGGVNAVVNAVMNAYKDAKKKADDTIDQVMSVATEGVPLPQ